MGGNLQEFIAANGLHYNSVELKSLREQDPALAENLSSMFARSSTYFKVHFTEALDLVRGRKVHVEGGFCFVPETEMLSLVAHIFRQHLTQALVFTNKVIFRWNNVIFLSCHLARWRIFLNLSNFFQ